MESGVTAVVGHVSEEDVVRVIVVTIAHVVATRLGAPKEFGRAQGGMDLAALATGLGGVGLVADDDLARVRPGFGQQTLSKPEVAPGEHCPGRSGRNAHVVYAVVLLLDHLGGFKLGQQHHIVRLAQPLGQSFVDVTYQVVDVEANAARRALQPVPAAVLHAGLRPLVLQLVQYVTQSVDTGHVPGAAFDDLTAGVVAGLERTDAEA